MPSCAVPTCNHSSSRKVKADDVKGWHMIPCDEKLQEKWIAASKREPPYPKKDSDFQFCGIHFADECFERNIMVELMGSKSYNLKEDAVPTIFLSSKSMRKRNSSEIRAARHVKKELISQIEVENLPCSSIKADEMGNNDVEDLEEIEGLEEEIEFESESQPDTELDASYEIEFESESQPDTELDASYEIEFESESQPDTELDASYEIEFESESQPDTELDASYEIEFESESQPDTELDASYEIEFESESQPDTELDASLRNRI